MSTQKIDWIKSQIPNIVDGNWSVLNRPALIANPASDRIPKSVDLTAIVNGMSDVDVLMLNTDYATVASALIENINKGQIEDVGNLVRGLGASNLSSESKAVISNNFNAIAQSYADPEKYGVLDPNWQPKILSTPAQSAGFTTVTYQEWLEANG